MLNQVSMAPFGRQNRTALPCGQLSKLVIIAWQLSCFGSFVRGVPVGPAQGMLCGRSEICNLRFRAPARPVPWRLRLQPKPYPVGLRSGFRGAGIREGGIGLPVRLAKRAGGLTRQAEERRVADGSTPVGKRRDDAIEMTSAAQHSFQNPLLRR